MNWRGQPKFQEGACRGRNLSLIRSLTANGVVAGPPGSVRPGAARVGQEQRISVGGLAPLGGADVRWRWKQEGRFDRMESLAYRPAFAAAFNVKTMRSDVSGVRMARLSPTPDGPGMARRAAQGAALTPLSRRVGDAALFACVIFLIAR